MSITNKKCLICQRIKLIKQGKNPYFIKELTTGYAVLGDYQFFPGYCLLLCKFHKTELHQLDQKFKLKFLDEMSQLAEAVFKTFKPDKLNYELLGNQDKHLHWHIFPRYKKEKKFNKPIWLESKKVRQAKKYILDKNEVKKVILKIRKNLAN